MGPEEKLIKSGCNSLTSKILFFGFFFLFQEFQEVPSVGIYRLRCNKEFNRYRLTLFPWQHAVWPGTLDPVAKDNVNRLYNGKYTSMV